MIIQMSVTARVHNLLVSILANAMAIEPYACSVYPSDPPDAGCEQMISAPCIAADLQTTAYRLHDRLGVVLSNCYKRFRTSTQRTSGWLND